jgi:hypothetical protein
MHELDVHGGPDDQVDDPVAIVACRARNGVTQMLAWPVNVRAPTISTVMSRFPVASMSAPIGVSTMRCDVCVAVS